MWKPNQTFINKIINAFWTIEQLKGGKKLTGQEKISERTRHELVGLESMGQWLPLFYPTSWAKRAARQISDNKDFMQKLISIMYRKLKSYNYFAMLHLFLTIHYV